MNPQVWYWPKYDELFVMYITFVCDFEYSEIDQEEYPRFVNPHITDCIYIGELD